MSKLLELSDILLIPAMENNGWNKKVDYSVVDNLEVTGMSKSLPIFTSPMEAIIGVNNWKVWQDNGIKTILPRTVPLNVRLEACTVIFSAFSIQEVKEYFIDRDMRSNNSQYHITIDSGNGHDTYMFYLGNKLKQMYGNQVILMGGNIANPNTYLQYSSSGFDYVRVGISSGSLVDKDKYGFHYPMASLLGSISQIKKQKGNTCRNVKVIADGGIKTHSDILKAIAMGADYVMIGRQFAECIEAYGTIYKRTIKSDQDIIEEVQNPESLKNLSDIELKNLDLVRQYFGNTTPEMQALRAGFNDIDSWNKSNPRIRITDSEWIWVNVTTSIVDWVKDFKECAMYGFMMSNSANWIEFKDRVLYGEK